MQDEADDPPSAVPPPPEEALESGGGGRRTVFVALGAAAGLAGLTAGCATPPLSAAANPSVPGAPAPRGRLEGQSVLVTGAARGIGRAVCLAAAREGADVLGFDIAGPASRHVGNAPATPADLAETGRLVQSLGRRFLAVQGDVRSRPALARAVDQAVGAFGKLDGVVANAGIMVPDGLAEVSDEGWRDVVDINLTGTANTFRAAIPAMSARRRGRMVAIASVLGRMGAPIAPQYNASKWGVIGLVKSAAMELGGRGIAVNAVSPTGVNTTLLRNPRQYAAVTPRFVPGRVPEAVAATASRNLHPLGVPWVEPEDVASVVVFLLSDEARYVSGASFDVTAGLGAIYTA
ncbi:SDR family NAD(P)-dependent oxidoreductase [Craurococcus roseus]|uniref:SDR family NAD(P)-dependent oxidoreductase n=1 Tax=Craurococcus roseus TaxID=77585 RepID=A0ABN1F1L5_9PROT